MKILITAGGTAEPLDGVRRITNTSTGATGGVIANTLAAHGVEVVLLHAADARLDGVDVHRESFVSYADLESALKRRLSGEDFDAIIHLAAVSDYTVASVEIDGRPTTLGATGKIDSGHDVVVRLSPTIKLIDRLRTWSRNTAIQIVGFKLTNTNDRKARESSVRSLLGRGTADLVVHNDLREIREDLHPATIWTPDGPIIRTQTKIELAESLRCLLVDCDRRRQERVQE